MSSSHSERCPVCNGSGKITEFDKTTSCPIREKTCHGCSGKGWVIVTEMQEGYYENINYSNHIPMLY